MKTTINKYFQIGWWFSDFKVASLLSNSEENQPQKRSKSLCLLQDKDYWKAVRIYNGNSPLDLLRIFNAEKKRISPFPAKVFWKIKKITFKQLQVEFYCIRYELYKELATQFKFVLPVVTQAESGVERFNTKRDIVVNHLDNSFEMIKKQSVLDLMGFYLSPYNSGSVHSKTWNVKLFSIVFCGSLALYISVSSAYLIVKTQWVSTSIEQNQSMANELINADKNLRKLAAELKKLTVFERSSPRPISLLAKLPLDADVITFNRFQLVGNDLQIFGETKNSATDILDLLLKSNEFKDVKFTLPVSKSRDGKEIFVIEAKIIDGK